MCSPQTLDIISRRVYLAARDVLGDKLEKVLLFGSYARGDYHKDSDIDYFVLADIPRTDACKTWDKIYDAAGDLDLEYDVVVSMHIVSSNIFHRASDVLPFYMNAIKEGKELAYA